MTILERLDSHDLWPGDIVRCTRTGRDEYGIVVQTYWDQGDLDCYVAFWGKSVPTMDETRPPNKPYVLKYYAASLEKVT